MANRADAAHGQISRRNGVQGVVVIHPEFTALWLGWRKLSESSIRWKAFWVEATSSLYGGGARATLVMQVVSEGGAATRRSRSRGQRCPRVVRPGNWRDHAGSGRGAKATRCDELSPDGAGWGCLQTTRERQRSALIESVKAPPGVTSRGGSACKWLAAVERRVSYGSSGSREHGFGRWSRSRGRPRRDRACTGRRRIEAGGR